MKNYVYKKKTGYICLLISIMSLFLYRMYLSETGMGYTALTYLTCMIIWMIFGQGFSDVTARMVRVRLSKGQKRSALDVLSISFACHLLAGLIGTALCGALNFWLMSDVLNLPKGRFLGLYLCVFFFPYDERISYGICFGFIRRQGYLHSNGFQTAFQDSVRFPVYEDDVRQGCYHILTSYGR